MKRLSAAVLSIGLAAAPATALAGPNDNSNKRPWALQIGAGPTLDIPFGFAIGTVGVDFQYHFKRGDVGPALGGLLHTHFGVGEFGFTTGPIFMWDFRVVTSSNFKLYVAPLAAAGFGLNTYGRGADPFFFADIGGQLKGVWNDRVGFFVRPATFSVWAGPFGGVGLWTLFGGLTLSF